MGSARGKQDGTGAVLAHIKDLTISHANEKGGIGNSAYTTDKQVFHTDVGDLIALMALEVAEEGGISRISSGAMVYNELAATRPDLIHTLSEPWPLDSFGGDPGYTARPVLYHEDGHIIIQYSRRHFTGYGLQKRSAHIPPISEAQAEALDAYQQARRALVDGLGIEPNAELKELEQAILRHDPSLDLHQPARAAGRETPERSILVAIADEGRTVALLGVAEPLAVDPPRAATSPNWRRK